MYLPQWTLQFKESKTEIKFIKGSYYKYEVRYQYNKEKKRTDKITVRLLGKLSETEGFIASDKNQLRQEAARLPKVNIKTFGLYHLFSDLLAAEIISLKASFKKDVIEKLLSFANDGFYAHTYCV